MAHSEEIARLEHELAELRQHYAQLERNGRMTKQGEKFFLAVIAVLLGYLLWTDFVAGVFAVIMAAALGTFIWFSRDKNFRWIDAGTPTGEFGLVPSQAQKVEQWIADREARLAALRLANDDGTRR